MSCPKSISMTPIKEIFSSLQGEGTHIGEKHLFIRFGECPMRCQYCDEREKESYLMTLDEVLKKVKEIDKIEGPHRFISLTGGEPLFAMPFVKPLIERLKQNKFRIYLETNGILWQELKEIIGWCDVVAMDMKPMSVTKSGSFEKEHYNFLEIAKIRETFVKIVISNDIDKHEYENLIRIVAEIDHAIPVILMPVSCKNIGCEDEPSISVLLDLQRIGSRIIDEVRIVPRIHRIFNMR